tara:strand:+ start:205 stop:375 length:171 start_codon:yes stop_codon:yes gene_type:complete
MNDNEDKDIQEFLNGLNEREKIALNIAKDMLGTSFNIKKSIGYIKWKKENVDNKKI